MEDSRLESDTVLTHTAVAVAAADRRVALGLFVLAAATFAWFFGGAGWNQDANFDLTRALVERRTLYIDGFDTNTGDVSRGSGGHVYINKSPGVSFLAAAPYAVVFAVERGMGVRVDWMARTNAWIVTAMTCGLCGACIGPVLYLYGRRRIGTTARGAVFVALAILFGTMVFPYSTMLFAHVPAALCLLLALTLIRDHPLAAGAAAGIATACFYVCVVAAAVLALTALCRSRRTATHFVLGAAPFAVLLAAYQWICFGSPFRTAVAASTFTQKGLLFGVLQMPRQEAIYGLSFSPNRGLFYASPVLLLAIAGGLAMARAPQWRLELATVVGIAVTFLLVISSFNFWEGGWAFGPRYILPVVPILGIPMLFATRIRSRALLALSVAAALLSVTVNFIATATDPMPSPGVHDPIRQYLLPAFLTGRIPEETRLAFPWYRERRVDKVALPREAGNLGETVSGKGRRSSVMPVTLWMIGGAALLFRGARRIDLETARYR